MKEKQGAIPGYAVYAALLFVLPMLCLQAYKAVFYLYFEPVFASAATGEISHALGVSLRFDVRLSILLALCPGVSAMILPGRYFSRRGFARASRWYFLLAGVFLCLLLMADMGDFAYTGERLNASLAEFLKNPLISLGMLWQSYPVVWGALGVAAVGAGYYFYAAWAYRLAARLGENRALWTRILWRAAVVLLAAWGLYGSTAHYPLRWSEAYFSKNKNVNALALNPVLNLFSTASAPDLQADADSMQAYLPVMSRYLGSALERPFERKVSADADTLRPNIVFVLLE